jgi:hypothetical protein
MSSYLEILAMDRRREVLRFLTDCGDYTSNGDVLLTFLNAIGIKSTRDGMITDLCWLQEQGFVALEDRQEFIVVTATERGVEIASGLARHPGVSRPRPRA